MAAAAAPQSVEVARQPAIVESPELETTAAAAPAPIPSAPAPVRHLHIPTRAPVASKKAGVVKSGPSLGLIAGAAVAALTVVAAGVSILATFKNSSKTPVKKQPTRPAAPARPGKSTSAKAPSRASTSSTRPAGTRSGTSSRRTSTTGGSRPPSRSSSTGGAAAGPTAVKKAPAKTAAAPSAVATAPKAAPAEKPKPAGASVGNGATTSAAAGPAPAAAQRTVIAAPALAATPKVVEKAAEEPAAPATPAPTAAAATTPPIAAAEAAPSPAPAVEAAAPTPAPAKHQQEVEVPATAAEPAAEDAPAPAEAAVPVGLSAAAEQESAAPAPAEGAAAVEPAAAEQQEPAAPAPAEEEAPVEPAVEPAAAAEPASAAPAPAAEAAPVEPAAAAEPASAAPAPAPAAEAAPVEPAAAAEQEPAAPAAPAPAPAGPEEEAAAGDAQGANGAQPQEGDDGLIELVEGEELPVIDDRGNRLGTLHSDGRVLDENGTEIGGVDGSGNIILYEQQQAEEPQLSATEEEAEQLMRQAAVAWNVTRNRDAAEKFQRKALEVVTKESGAARPEIIAEVASSLADMLYASDKVMDAKEVLQVALDAAEAAGQHALYIKLSNNMGAVLRKQDLHEEGKVLHQKAMQVALDHFGVAHATTTLARGNLVDALDMLGDRETARTLLTDSIEQISKVAEQKEAEESAKGGKPSEAETAAAVAAALREGQSPELAAMLAVDSSKAYTAAIRVQIELARLEMKDKQFDQAVVVLEQALDMAKGKFGDETAEASSVMAALATCHRHAGNLDISVTLFEQLYGINERQSEGGAANQSGIMLARTICDVLQEADRNAEALQWAEKSLSLMQQVAGMRVHPALEPYFNLVIDLKNKTGDAAGAEELRKQLLKAKLQFAGQAQRAGPNSKAAAAGKPPSGQAASRAGAAGKSNGKRGGKKK